MRGNLPWLVLYEKMEARGCAEQCAAPRLTDKQVTSRRCAQHFAVAKEGI